MTKPVLEIQHLFWSAMGCTILNDISLSILKGQFVGLIGPNGCGKSSLMRCIYGVNEADSGDIALNGHLKDEMLPKDVAKDVSVLLQEHVDQFGQAAEEVVKQGLLPYRNWYHFSHKQDETLIVNSMKDFRADKFYGLQYSLLSGGEKQRVDLARSTVELPTLLLLDEPTNHLDIRFQIETLNKVKAIVKNKQFSVFATFHDLNIAASYCDYIYVMDKGVIVAQGSPSEVLTKELVLQVYGVNVEVVDLHGSIRLLFDYAVPEGK